MGCDGIFDRMSSEEVVDEIWHPMQPSMDGNLVPLSGQGTVPDVCGASADRVIRAAMHHESYDNLSVVMIAFKNFSRFLERYSNQLTQQAKAAKHPLSNQGRREALK